MHGRVLGHQDDDQADQVERERRHVIVGKVRADQEPVKSRRRTKAGRDGAWGGVGVG